MTHARCGPGPCFTSSGAVAYWLFCVAGLQRMRLQRCVTFVVHLQSGMNGVVNPVVAWAGSMLGKSGGVCRAKAAGRAAVLLRHRTTESTEFAQNGYAPAGASCSKEPKINCWSVVSAGLLFGRLAATKPTRGAWGAPLGSSKDGRACGSCF